MYYGALVVAATTILILSPVEDKNKPLEKTEHKVYKKRAILIMVAEIIIGVLLKLMGLENLFIAVVFSFVVLSLMLTVGIIKKWVASLNIQ